MQTGRFTLAVNGTGLQNGSVVRVNGASTTTTFSSSSKLTATGSISTAGNAIPVTVVNPDGQVSNAATIAVTTPSAPTVSSVSPTTMQTGTFTLTINGTGFQNGSVVRVNGASTTTTFNSSSRLTATGSLATAGSAIPVTVVNPDGQVSNAASIAVTTPSAPTVSSVSPTTMQTGTFTLTINGTGFQNGSVVRVNGASTTTTFNSSSRLTATGSLATAGSAIPVTVVNPDGQVSNAASIAVTAPPSTPVSVWITPSSVNMGVGLRVQFQATVLNTTNQFVTWKVNGIVGGNATVGTITQTGLYTAPAVVPAMPLLSVDATSAADPTRTTSSLVRIFQ